MIIGAAHLSGTALKANVTTAAAGGANLLLGTAVLSDVAVLLTLEAPHHFRHMRVDCELPPVEDHRPREGGSLEGKAHSSTGFPTADCQSAHGPDWPAEVSPISAEDTLNPGEYGIIRDSKWDPTDYAIDSWDRDCAGDGSCANGREAHQSTLLQGRGTADYHFFRAEWPDGVDRSNQAFQQVGELPVERLERTLAFTCISQNHWVIGKHGPGDCLGPCTLLLILPPPSWDRWGGGPRSTLGGWGGEHAERDVGVLIALLWVSLAGRGRVTGT